MHCADLEKTSKSAANNIAAQTFAISDQGRDDQRSPKLPI